MIRNVTKKIMAVPKSPMSPRHPKQKAENPMNIQRFFFWKSSSSVAAPIQINATFTSSEGWKLNPPISSQFLAPKPIVPNIRLTMRSSAEPPMSSHLRDLLLSRFLIKTHMTNIIATPIAAAINCLYIFSGAELATTARLSVDRKNAIVSISKPVLPILLSTPV